MRRRFFRQPIDTHHEQQDLDEIFTGLHSMFELYNNLTEIAKNNGDPTIQKAYQETRFQIQNKIKQLYSRGVSVVDLVQKFGSLIVKSDILKAQQNINDQEQKQGEVLLTDLVSEDRIISDRALETKQLGQQLGFFGSKVTNEQILKSKRLQDLADIIARRKLQQQSENVAVEIAEEEAQVLQAQKEQQIEEMEEQKEDIKAGVIEMLGKKKLTKAAEDRIVVAKNRFQDIAAEILDLKEKAPSEIQAYKKLKKHEKLQQLIVESLPQQTEEAQEELLEIIEMFTPSLANLKKSQIQAINIKKFQQEVQEQEPVEDQSKDVENLQFTLWKSKFTIEKPEEVSQELLDARGDAIKQLLDRKLTQQLVRAEKRGGFGLSYKDIAQQIATNDDEVKVSRHILYERIQESIQSGEPVAKKALELEARLATYLQQKKTAAAIQEEREASRFRKGKKQEPVEEPIQVPEGGGIMRMGLE